MTIQFTLEQIEDCFPDEGMFSIDSGEHAGHIAITAQWAHDFANAIALQVSAAYEAEIVKLRDALKTIKAEAYLGSDGNKPNMQKIHHKAGNALSTPTSTDALDKLLREKCLEVAEMMWNEGEKHWDCKRIVKEVLAKMTTQDDVIDAAEEYASNVRNFRTTAAGGMIKEMIDRFLSWTLPCDFSPDAGITFTPTDLQKSGVHGWPTGTNLFTADQADKMIGYVAAPLLAKLLMCIHEETLNTTPQQDTDTAIKSAKPVTWTDDELTKIYNEANGITEKNPPISSQKIFAAMRYIANLCPPPGHKGENE